MNELTKVEKQIREKHYWEQHNESIKIKVLEKKIVQLMEAEIEVRDYRKIERFEKLLRKAEDQLREIVMNKSIMSIFNPY